MLYTKTILLNNLFIRVYGGQNHFSQLIERKSRKPLDIHAPAASVLYFIGLCSCG